MTQRSSKVNSVKTKVRWRRRKEARPGEIVQAALQVFLERGFAAATVSSIAKQAGVAKGSVYLYYPSKEALFRAAIEELTGKGIGYIGELAKRDAPAEELVRELVLAAADLLGTEPVPAVIQLVIASSHAMPDIAAIWHETVPSPVIRTLASIIVRGQERGEIVVGNPHALALSFLGPLVMSTIFRQVFVQGARKMPKLRALAEQHVDSLLSGVLAKQT
jgi:AcrR family transcriptional regulator